MTDRDPFREVDELFERLNRQLDQLGRQFDPGLSSRGVRVDVAEHDDEVVVTADLPGFEKDDIEVTVQDRTLAIEADREEETEEEREDGPQYHRHERRRTSVSRRVELPVEVDKSDASAGYTNGVLTVTLPKATVDEGGHTIDVS